jgi:hypothetical protein
LFQSSAFGCGGRPATGSREILKAPGGPGSGFNSFGRRSRSECLRPKVRHDARIRFSTPC